MLVEAKAHVPELMSPATKAAGASLALIRQSLACVQCSLHASPGVDWSLCFYQYANRIAHAWFFAEMCNQPVRLVFLNFIGDVEMAGPSSRAEWESALAVIHAALGIRGRMPRYVCEVFVDVRPPVPIVV